MLRSRSMMGGVCRSRNRFPPGVVDAQAETDRAVGHGEGNAHRAQNVEVAGSRGACRTGGGADPYSFMSRRIPSPSTNSKLMFVVFGSAARIPVDPAWGCASGAPSPVDRAGPLPCCSPLPCSALQARTPSQADDAGGSPYLRGAPAPGAADQEGENLVPLRT